MIRPYIDHFYITKTRGKMVAMAQFVERLRPTTQQPQLFINIVILPWLFCFLVNIVSVLFSDNIKNNVLHVFNTYSLLCLACIIGIY